MINGELIVDNFAGGGGTSTGIEIATGHSVDIAINHDPEAIRMHKVNHPGGNCKNPIHTITTGNQQCVISADKEIRIHPTQKPIALYEWILSRYAMPGDIILDTHVGSASSLIACYNTNHKFVGFELDKYYYELSKKRLDAEMAQMRLEDIFWQEGEQ